jgi:hypothetical protein
MIKFHNYVLLSIAEKSYSLFEGTKYKTYDSFCRNFNESLKDSNNMSRQYHHFLFSIVVEIKIIYGLTTVEAVKYIKGYFSLDSFVLFETYIKNMQIANPFYFIDK